MIRKPGKKFVGDGSDIQRICPGGFIKTGWTSEQLNYYSLRLRMKKNPAITVLLVILVASALCSVAFCLLYINSARQLRDLQRSAAMAQNYRNLILSLGNDALEYSKKNAAIDPLLEAAGFKPKAGSAAATATNKPASK